MTTITQARKKYSTKDKIVLFNREYIEYESRIINVLDKWQKLNPELVDKVHDWYLAKNSKGNWSPRWIK